MIKLTNGPLKRTNGREIAGNGARPPERHQSGRQTTQIGLTYTDFLCGFGQKEFLSAKLITPNVVADMQHNYCSISVQMLSLRSYHFRHNLINRQ
jgi:hypothetical protein